LLSCNPLGLFVSVDISCRLAVIPEIGTGCAIASSRWLLPVQTLFELIWRFENLFRPSCVTSAAEPFVCGQILYGPYEFILDGRQTTFMDHKALSQSEHGFLPAKVRECVLLWVTAQRFTVERKNAFNERERLLLLFLRPASWF